MLRLTLALVTLLALPAAADPKRAFVALGVGLPELVHAEVGVFLGPRTTVDLRAGLPVFNPELGVGVSWLPTGEVVDGAPPRHSVLCVLEGRVNPTSPFRLASGGDRLGLLVGAYVGYAFHSGVGFLARLTVGPTLSWESGPAFGVNTSVLVGWAI